MEIYKSEAKTRGWGYPVKTNIQLLSSSFSHPALDNFVLSSKFYHLALRSTVAGLGQKVYDPSRMIEFGGRKVNDPSWMIEFGGRKVDDSSWMIEAGWQKLDDSSWLIKFEGELKLFFWSISPFWRLDHRFDNLYVFNLKSFAKYFHICI